MSTTLAQDLEDVQTTMRFALQETRQARGNISIAQAETHNTRAQEALNLLASANTRLEVAIHTLNHLINQVPLLPSPSGSPEVPGPPEGHIGGEA